MAHRKITNRLPAAAWLDQFGIWFILVLAAITRFVNLGFPHQLVFDETYYVKDAWTLGNLGYEGSWPDTPNPRFESGEVDIYSSAASYVVHPPLGKWIIFVGMRIWGAENSAGWRFSVALLSVASVWLIYLVAARLFGSKRWALLPAFLLTIDGHAIVLGRTALLDGILAFFVLLAFYFLLCDREQLSSQRGIWSRPWFLASVVTLALSAAVKWSGFYFLAFFFLYVVVSDTLRDRRIQLADAQTPSWKTTGVAAFWEAIRLGVPTLLITVATYLITWTGWFTTNGGYYRELTASQTGFPDWLAWIPQPLQNYWYYQLQAYNFHVNLHQPHGYQSNALLWLLPIRPTAFWFQSTDAGTTDCSSSDNCVNAITALGNPAIWIAAVAALSYIAVHWYRQRTQNSGLILLGLAAGYVPWLMYLNRTTFQFYAIVFLPWMLLALGLWFKLMFDSAEDKARVRSRIRAFLVLAMAMSLFFSNIWFGYTTDYWYWHIHMWLPSWI